MVDVVGCGVVSVVGCRMLDKSSVRLVCGYVRVVGWLNDCFGGVKWWFCSRIGGWMVVGGILEWMRQRE